MMPVKQITEQQQVEAPAHELVLPVKFVGKFIRLDTTPSVKNCERWICQNTAPLNVTNFDDGQDGQEIQVLGDGQTTVIHDVTKIICLSGANTLLAVNTVYVYTRFNNIWIEH